MVFDDPDESYDILLGLTDDGRERVRPFDASCSLLVWRIEDDRRTVQMPPGDPLDDPERCAIRMWIDAGAER